MVDSSFSDNTPGRVDAPLTFLSLFLHDSLRLLLPRRRFVMLDQLR
jgi:hypothetical protein